MSPIAREGYYDVAAFARDMARLGDLSGGLLCKLRILGGEPLLHPRVAEFLVISRKNFPETSIDLVTNAILLPKMPESFFSICRENNIAITPTKYPIKLDFAAIEALVKKHGVKFRYANDTDKFTKTMFYQPLDLEGRQNPVEMFYKCPWANGCIAIDNGRLYPCPWPRNIKHFNARFDKNLRVTSRDYIDIYAARDMEEVLARLAKPIPFCRYCDLNRMTWENPWQKSTKNIEEWS